MAARAGTGRRRCKPLNPADSRGCDALHFGDNSGVDKQSLPGHTPGCDVNTVVAIGESIYAHRCSDIGSAGILDRLRRRGRRRGQQQSFQIDGLAAVQRRRRDAGGPASAAGSGQRPGTLCCVRHGWQGYLDGMQWSGRQNRHLRDFARPGRRSCRSRLRALEYDAGGQDRSLHLNGGPAGQVWNQPAAQARVTAWPIIPIAF